MTKIEKIANAKQRIQELERLIKYWDDSEENNHSIEMNKIDFEKNTNSIAA